MFWLIFLVTVSSLIFYFYSQRKSMYKIKTPLEDKQKTEKLKKIIPSNNDKQRIIKMIRVMYRLSTHEAVEVYKAVKK
ncbi:hypothetical protein ACFC37_03015 [Enterococcus durans]|uniref:hypothetical protein n=1 Tax=Enterococcus durans TaxID=53345 RepID=UPI0039A65BA6